MNHLAHRLLYNVGYFLCMQSKFYINRDFMENISEYTQALILWWLWWLAKAILTYIIDKKITIKHSISLVVLWSIISLWLVPLSWYITDDVNVRVSIWVFWWLLASTLIRFIEDVLPNVLRSFITKKWL